MVRERAATLVACKLAKAINLASAAVVLIGIFLFAGTALAQQVDDCPNGKLDPGDQKNPPDLIIGQECHVGRGVHYFNNVNIITGNAPGMPRTPGKLIFDDDSYGIGFSARSIVVENGGSLEAGTPDKPFGSLQIDLYGKDQGVQGRSNMQVYRLRSGQ
jgi:hypothetical protein